MAAPEQPPPPQRSGRRPAAPKRTGGRPAGASQPAAAPPSRPAGNVVEQAEAAARERARAKAEERLALHRRVMQVQEALFAPGRSVDELASAVRRR